MLTHVCISLMTMVIIIRHVIIIIKASGGLFDNTACTCCILIVSTHQSQATGARLHSILGQKGFLVAQT